MLEKIALAIIAIAASLTITSDNTLPSQSAIYFESQPTSPLATPIIPVDYTYTENDLFIKVSPVNYASEDDAINAFYTTYAGMEIIRFQEIDKFLEHGYHGYISFYPSGYSIYAILKQDESNWVINFEFIGIKSDISIDERIETIEEILYNFLLEMENVSG